jgi:NTE family protein
MLFSLWNRGEQTPPEDGVPVDRQEKPVSKPRIGLALGGGVARGWAHIGILRTLLKADIVPDVIAGTSIGALVGGAWAAGRLDVLDDWSRTITKRRLLGLLDVTIRASYALPGIFGPVQIGGRWLVDGARVNPIPVSAARALGARVVIAVNLNSDMFGRGTVIQAHAAEAAQEAEAEIAVATEPEPGRIGRLFRMQHNIRHDVLSAARGPGITSVMVDAFNITQDRIARSRLAGDPPDVLISPKLGAIGMFEFHRAEEAIRLGAEAAERALTDIQETVAALS